MVIIPGVEAGQQWDSQRPVVFGNLRLTPPSGPWADPSGASRPKALPTGPEASVKNTDAVWALQQ